MVLDNITSTLYTSQQILEMAHKEVAMPAVIYTWIAAVLLFLIVGILSIDSSRGRHPYRRFMIIWVIATALSGLVAFFIISSPNTVQSIADFIKDF